MIITKLERQKRDPHRVNVYLDDEFAFGVHEDVLVKYGLRKGDTLDQATIKTIQSSEELSHAKEKALKFLSYRLRSEKELRTKLREKEFPPNIIDEVIDHFRSLGLVDDRKFAQSLVHDLQLRRPAGKKLIQQKLRLKGIAQPIIQEVIAECMSSDDEQELAVQAAQKLLKRYRSSRKKIDPKKQQQRIAQFLARRGFDWSTVSPVLHQIFKIKNLKSKI
ncbi:MAG: RecX family transcriptional regulator [Ignavibacteriae bacterium]|nr:RecX family transcriptional regulator [Ignavibacteriota bacterium]